VDRVALTDFKGMIYPFYLVIDVSQSMHETPQSPGAPASPFAIAQRAIPLIEDELRDSPRTRDTAAFGLITFSGEASVVTPLTRLRDLDGLDPLREGTETNYQAVFELVVSVIEADMSQLASAGHLVKRPVVYFITDGQPVVDRRTQELEEWAPAYREFDSLPLPPAIVALGMGKVHPMTIRRIASTRPRGVACIAEPGATPSSLIAGILDAVGLSIHDSTRQGDLEFEVPDGMTSLEPLAL
jgi:uncharacterized protein YegL